MGAGAAVNYTDLPQGAKVLSAPQQRFSDVPEGARVLPPNAPGTITGNVAEMRAGKPAAGKPYRKFQGSGFERAASYFGENLRNAGEAIQHPLNTISGMLSSTTPPIDAAEDRYKTDPAAAVGDAGTVALTSTIMGQPPGLNLAESSGSTFVPEGIAHPLQGAARAFASLPEPDLLSAIRRPVSSAFKVARALPNAIKAGMGDDIRIQPAMRVAPAWQTQPAAGTLVDSIFNRQPNAGPTRTPNTPRAPRPAPAWQSTPNEGTPVDSILNRQPYAQPSAPRLIEQMGGKPVETITEDASSRGIGQAEWESGHQISREVENTPRPSLKQRVRAELQDVQKRQSTPKAAQDKSLLPQLKKSLQKVRSQKAGLAKAGD